MQEWIQPITQITGTLVMVKCIGYMVETARDEPVNPREESGIDLGFEGTADSGRIIDKLNAMSHEEFKFDLLS